MRKLKRLIVMLLSIICMMVVPSIIAQAESIPIKKIIDRNYVLLENGDLIWTDINNNQKTKVVKTNVKDCVNNTFLTVLLDDGTLIDRVGDKYETTIDTGVTQMYSSSVYLKNNTLYDNSSKYNNLKEIVAVTGDGVFALDNNDSLYICYYQNKKIKIADNVAKANLSNIADSNYIITKDNKLLSFDLNKSKETVQLNIISNNIIEFGKYLSNRTNGESESLVISDSGKLLKVNHYGIIKEYDIDGIKELCFTTGAGNNYSYYCKLSDNQIVEIKEKSNKVDYNIIDNGMKYKTYMNIWKIGEDNILYYNYNTNSVSKNTIIDYDVDKIIDGGNDSLSNLIYQKLNGDIYVYDVREKCSYLYQLAIKQTNLIFNNKKLELEDNIQIKNGRSMYPFREILEAIGATVMWDSQNKTAIGILNGTRVEFKIGTNEYIVNGETKYMDIESYIDPIVDKTYIPIRYVAEALGFNVDWQAGRHENTITISKNNNSRYKTVSYDISEENIKEDKNINIAKIQPFLGLTQTMMETTGSPSKPGIDTAIDAFSFVTSWIDNSLEITKLHVTTGKDNTIVIKYGSAIESQYSGKEATLEMLLIDKYYAVTPGIIFTSSKKADECIRNWFGLSGNGKYSMTFSFGKVYNGDYGYYLMVDGENMYQIPIIHKDTAMNVYYTENGETKLLFDVADVLRNTKFVLSNSEKEKVMKKLNDNGYMF